MRHRVLVLSMVAMAIVAAGCASQSSAPAAGSSPGAISAAGPEPFPRRLSGPLPPPAEPATAPPTSTVPAGQVISVGSAPEGIVADPVSRTVAVGVRSPNSLALISADSGTVTARLPLPGVLRHLQLVGPGGPVLVPDESSNSLLRVALPAGPISSRVLTGISPHDATEAPDGTVFVANEGGGTVVAVRGDRVIRTFTDVTQPAGVSPVGNRVGLVDVRENTITFYDAETLTGIAELPAGTGPTHVVADRHGRMVVSDTRGGQLLVFDPTGTPRQVGQLAVPGQPYGITYDPVRDRLWVTVTAANQVVGYDMGDSTPREVARIPTVRQPNTVAVDPTTGRLFVTGTNDGTVQIITP